MAKYIGITIGPIATTMNFVSSPAALWASSYLFSSICRKICEVLIDSYCIDKEDIIAPYYDRENDILTRNDGVGLFHDRIIFEAKDFIITDLKKIKGIVIQQISTEFELDEEYLREYILIIGAEFESDRPLLDSGRILDSLELSTPFVTEENGNPIIKTFTSCDEDGNETSARNEQIKRIATENLKICAEKWQLLSDGKIKDIGMIARTTNTDKKLKINKYYAVLRSDGDRMSKIISSLNGKEDYRDFSKRCLDYCAEVAELVAQYKGFTVYSGGDDLLAIVPCESDFEEQNNTIFNLIKKINESFNNNFKDKIDKIRGKNIPIPSLSFGIYIAYYKFPLYEALTESYKLLQEIAKTDDRRDCVVACMQKHSGQSATLVIPNVYLDAYIKLQNVVLNKRNSDKSKFLLSAMQKIALFRQLYDYAQTDNHISNFFSNTFDSEEQKKFKDDLDAIIQFWKEAKKIEAATCRVIETIDEFGELITSKASVINSILRLIKLFIEKGDEE